MSDRDRDWVLAMAAALGTDSGFHVPIVPEPEAFKQLFSAIREADRKAIIERCAGIADSLKRESPRLKQGFAASRESGWRAACEHIANGIRALSEEKANG